MTNQKNISIRNRFLTLISFLLVVLFISPIVLSEVILLYEYPTNVGSISPFIYLTRGPDYGKPNPIQGLPPGNTFEVAVSGTPPNVVSGSIMYINSTPGPPSPKPPHAPLAVLEINNIKFQATLTISGSLPKGFTLYYGSKPNHLSSPYTLGNAINIPVGSPSLYFGFSYKGLPTNPSPEFGIITFQYVLANYIIITYQYTIKVNE